MQRKIIFRSKCPSCDNNDGIIEWKHSGCQGIGYLDTNGDITCENCYKIINLLDTQFNCSKHEYLYSNYNGFNQLNTIINFILKKMNIDKGFEDKLLYNVTNRWHERYG